ncbi:2OG-Fe(II) oxygenase family protein [Rhodanobacter sp. C05]|jgi:isopenicillin N synthase-like dioxygenase|uniref:2OG-Fe(II) oxygenase family protein n=1 Tax=Rhodanobacter sp. C05 TaxID=1945855 RepID=UPI0009863F50|nr:2OG-Fe(II) oxygenase family protein [Rhodanobacter sp. C05]
MNEISRVVDGLLENGYAVFSMPPTLREAFRLIPAGLAEISEDEKQQFCFPEQLDGFLPFGSEYAANNPGHPDLCERFCYFQKYRALHARYPTASTSFYRAIVAYEQAAAALSNVVLDAVFARLGGTAPKAPGDDSYIQVCRYNLEYSAAERQREYRMDPHVDSQLLTFIAQTDQGLMVGDHQRLQHINFAPDEIFVMAGKLLELATDNEIRSVLHAVSCDEAIEPRLSIMYFQNPCFRAPPYASLRHGSSIDFYAVADVIHQSFGNPSYRNSVS